MYKIHILNKEESCKTCQCGRCEVRERPSQPICGLLDQRSYYSNVLDIIVLDLKAMAKCKTKTADKIKIRCPTYYSHIYPENEGKMFYCMKCLKAKFPKYSPRKIAKALDVWARNPIAGMTVDNYVKAVLGKRK